MQPFNGYIFLFFKQIISGGKLPYGQVPILEYDGKILAQTATILKYGGREIG